MLIYVIELTFQWCSHIPSRASEGRLDPFLFVPDPPRRRLVRLEPCQD
jgi:hypothetical protein